MQTDSNVAALLEQAARNLDTLEQLLRSGADDASKLEVLRHRLSDLKDAYTRETNALTQQVLRHAIERRCGEDRRRKSKQ
jgi:hypothetical protein